MLGTCPQIPKTLMVIIMEMEECFLDQAFSREWPKIHKLSHISRNKLETRLECTNNS